VDEKRNVKRCHERLYEGGPIISMIAAFSEQMHCIMGSPNGQEERPAHLPASTLEVTKPTTYIYRETRILISSTNSIRDTTITVFWDVAP